MNYGGAEIGVIIKDWILGLIQLLLKSVLEQRRTVEEKK